jgi:hypothetical protein
MMQEGGLAGRGWSDVWWMEGDGRDSGQVVGVRECVKIQEAQSQRRRAEVGPGRQHALSLALAGSSLLQASSQQASIAAQRTG